MFVVLLIFFFALNSLKGNAFASQRKDKWQGDLSSAPFTVSVLLISSSVFFSQQQQRTEPESLAFSCLKKDGTLQHSLNPRGMSVESKISRDFCAPQWARIDACMDLDKLKVATRTFSFFFSSFFFG